MTLDPGLAAHLGRWADGDRPAPPTPPELLDELRGTLEAAAAEAAEHLPPDAEPVRLNKRRISALLDCEEHLLATLDQFAPPNEPLVVGALLDALVDHYVTTGRTDPNPFDLARDLLEAAGDPGAQKNLAWLDSRNADDLRRIADDVADRREQLLADWPVFQPEWWARTQERAVISLAGGRVIVEGRTDLALGGAPSPLPAVILEVKAGEFVGHDRDDMLLYALLGTLRDGTAPAMVITTMPGAPPIVDDIREGHLLSATRRLADALRAVGRLAAGVEPKRNPSWRCRRCPAQQCPHVGTRPIEVHGDAF